MPQAALLAGIPSDPTRYDPKTNPRAARERRALVLELMADQGLIAPDELLVALNAPTAQAAVHPSCPARSLGARLPTSSTTSSSSWWTSTARSEVFGGGLRVKTTIDLGLQELARKAIAKWLTDVGPEAALVAVRPDSGRIVAMVGGSNFRESQFNLAVQGERQAGSSFKPFVLAAALREGLSTSNTFDSKPVEIWADGRLWEVENYEGAYLGTHRPALGDDPLRQLGLRAAHPAGRAALGRGRREGPRDHQPAQRVLRDRPRRRGDQPARDGPGVLDLREQRAAGGRVGVRQRAAGDRLGRARR